MRLETVEQHIQEIQQKRESLLTQSLGFINSYYKTSRSYYLIMLSLSLIIILVGISLFFTFESDSFIRGSLFFATTSFFYALIAYLSYLEKGAEKISTVLKDVDWKYLQEINILRNFYAGRIDEVDIRKFYLAQELGINPSDFGNNLTATFRWINFVLVSLALILILFNFF